MTNVEPFDIKKTPYQTALDIMAVFTEFGSRSTERSQILVNAFGGIGRSVEEPKLVWLCAGAGLKKQHLASLVSELVSTGCLDQFYDDQAAIDVLSYHVIASACAKYVQNTVMVKAQSEQVEQVTHDFFDGGDDFDYEAAFNQLFSTK